MPYMVQEYLTGEDLTEKIARRDLSVKARAEYLLHIAQGLAYAHDHNVVHRDIKPGNIRITDDGQLRILDFGIARLLGQTRPFTTDGVTLGTVGYMAPELLTDDEVDWRCDVFSYGVVAYELLSYSLPFQGDTFVRISYRLLNEEPPPLAEVVPDCPPALIRLVERCLRKRREERFTTFHQVVEELAQLLDDTGTQPQAAPSTDSAPVLTVSGGAPTTPVPQAALASAVVTSPDPDQSPVPNSPPTAPVQGRRVGPGMRRMVGIAGLALGAIAAVVLLPKTIHDMGPTAPSQDGAVHVTAPPTDPGPLAETQLDASSQSVGDSPAVESPALDSPAVDSPTVDSATAEDVEQAPAPSSLEPSPQDAKPPSSVAQSRPALAEPSESGEAQADPPAHITEAPEPVAAVLSQQAEVTPAEESPESASPTLDTSSTDTRSTGAGATASATPPAAPPEETVTANEPAGLESTELQPPMPAEIVPPRLLEQVQPEYPSRARRRRLEATVNVAVWVEADGRVERTTVKSVSARGMGFEDAATEAARQSRFAAGTEGGKPKAMWTEIVFHFRLSG